MIAPAASSRRGPSGGKRRRRWWWWVALPLALLLLAAAIVRLLHPSGTDVVLITIDTLRADHVSCYGNRAETPSIDRLSRQGVRFGDASTNIPRTTQAVSSLMTGRYPQNHGVRALHQHLPDSQQTLAMRLEAAGFRTAAFIAGGPVEPATGLDRGFETYDTAVDRKALPLLLRTLPWIAWNSPRRTFLWVHFFDPHFGYQPPWPFNRRPPEEPPGFSVYKDIYEGRLTFGRLHFFPPLREADHAHLRALYRGEVEYADAMLGWLLRAIRLRDRITGRRSLVVLTADHGESLGEHKCWYEHGEYVYEEDVRIPFIVVWPGVVRAGARSTVGVESIDLAPTLLDLLGLPPLPDMDGRSLVPALRGGTMPPRPVFVESDVNMFPENPRRKVDGVRGKWRSIRVGAFKLILIPEPSGETLELYDLEKDPGETRNLASAEPVRTQELRAKLGAWLASAHATRETGVQEMDEDTKRRLKSLGYLD